MAVSCNTLYLGGEFTTIAGQARNRLAALDLRTGLASGWDPNANDDVLKVLLSGNLLYVGGKFTQIGQQSRAFLAAVDVDTGRPATWSPRADFGVAGLVVSGGTVVAGGSFGAGGKVRKNVAAIDFRTGQPLDWHPKVTGTLMDLGVEYTGVYALAASANKVYIGGPFSGVDGQPRRQLAALDARTGVLLAWDAAITNGSVMALATMNNRVYVGGRFSFLGGVARTNLAALDASTGLLTSWLPNPNDIVSTILCRGNSIYVGGRFTRLGGQKRNRLACLDAAKGLPTAWNPDASDQVTTLSVLGNALYAGGLFWKMGGQPRTNLAALDLLSGTVSCWNPGPSTEVPWYPEVDAILTDLGHTAYIAGSFSRIAGQPRQNLAAIHTNCLGTLEAWDPGCDGPVRALATSDGMLFAGGSFHYVGNQYRPGLAVFPAEGSPVIIVQPQSQAVFSGASALFEVQATGRSPLSYQWQLNGTNIPGATNPTYRLPQVQIANAGEYRLVVTNRLGLINSHPATLIAIEALQIITQPTDQTVGTGSTVTLSVLATGNPPPIYQWRLNGVNIPGAIYSTLTITNAQPTDGGSYSVVVANIGGAISSDTATVRVTSLALPFADNLPDRGHLTTPSGLGSGTNVSATREPGEPHHAGKIGGRSVWLGWIAPASGIATFSTRGCDFDTLLGIYTNDFSLNPQPSTSNLGAVAEDEDRGGYLTSQASFNAIADTEYLIAVDGFAGASGNLVLSWSLDASTVPFPRILTQPLSQSVFVGQDVTFSVTVNSPTPVSYQWFFGCSAIPEATNATLTIRNVQRRDVGDYRVWVMNASSQAAQSEVAALEIGPEPKFVSQDKPEDLFPELLSAGMTSRSKASPRSGSVAQGFISVALGNVDSQLLNNTDATTQPGEPLHCGVLGGASKWMRLRPESDGLFVIDTIGSSLDTVLAVYYSTNLLWLSQALVACDDNGAPDGICSLVQFTGRSATDYLVAVDGVNGAKGTINVNWKFGQGPILTPAPSPRRNPDGSLTLVTLMTNGIPVPSYQWLLNGVKIPDATNSTWQVRAPHTAVGTYSVVASNFFGSVVQTVATLVDLAYEARLQNGVLRLRLPSDLSQPVLLQGSSNLTDWMTVQVLDPAVSHTVEVPLTNRPARFFRVCPER